MLDRTTIRPDRFYWVKKRKSNEGPTIAFLYGEIPSLSIRVLSDESYPICCSYDFLADADMDALFRSAFHGLTIEALTESAT